MLRPTIFSLVGLATVAAVTVAVPKVQANVAAPTTTIASNGVDTAALRAEAAALAATLRSVRAARPNAQPPVTPRGSGVPSRPHTSVAAPHDPRSSADRSTEHESTPDEMTPPSSSETSPTTAPSWSGDNGHDDDDDDGGEGADWGDR